MSYAADGPLLTSLAAAKATLAATHQWTQIATADRIYFDALPAPSPGPDYTAAQMIAARPFAIMWHEVSAGFRLDSAAADMHHPLPSGKIITQIELNVPTEHANNPTAVAIWANRTIGRLLRTADDAQPGLWDLANRPGFLPIHSIEVDGYIRTDRKEKVAVGDAIVFEFAINWGAK